MRGWSHDILTPFLVSFILFEECWAAIVLTYQFCHLINFQVVRDFKRPDGMTESEIDAAGDGMDY